MDGDLKSDLSERVNIQEKALQELADRVEKRQAKIEEEMKDTLEELRALKMFLSRQMPEFKTQYPDIRKKIKAA